MEKVSVTVEEMTRRRDSWKRRCEHALEELDIMHRKAEAWRESTMRGLDVIDRKNHQIEQLEASLEGRTTKLAEAERELAALVMLLKELGTPS